jgi:signal transduction histidine kinase/PAS domain-containing protein
MDEDLTPATGHLDGLTVEEFRRAVRSGYTENEIDMILALLSAMPVAIWAAAGSAGDYAIELWSQGATRIYGYESGEVLGENYLDQFVNRLERKQAIADHQMVEGTGIYYRNLARDRIKDQTTRLLLTQGIRLWNPEREHFVQGEVAVDVSEVPTRDRDWLEQVLTPEAMNQFLLGSTRANRAAVNSIQDVARESVDLIRTLLTEAADVLFFTTDAGGKLSPLEFDEPAPPSTLTRACEFEPQAVVRWCAAVDREYLQVEYTQEFPVPARRGQRTRAFPEAVRSPQAKAPFAVRLLRQDGVARAAIFVVQPPKTHFAELVSLLLEMITGALQLALVHEERISQTRNAGEFAAMQREKQATVRLARQYRHTVLKKAHLLRMYSGLLSEEEPTGKVRQIAEALEAMAQSLQTSGEGFRVELSPEEFSAADMLSSVTGDLMSQHPDIHLEREVDTSANLFGIRPFLEGAFENILVNAAEAMDFRGRIGVWVSQTNPAARGAARTLNVHICDDGPGVPPALRASWMEEGASSKGPGRGYGLSIATRTVEECGGRIELLEPQPGWSGACWNIVLPVATRPRRKAKR